MRALLYLLLVWTCVPTGCAQDTVPARSIPSPAITPSPAIPPTAPTLDSASKKGSYTVQTYSDGIPVPPLVSYANPLIYYPVDGIAPFPGVIFIPGHGDRYMESPELLTQWGALLASHGFAVLFVNPTDIGVGPFERVAALREALDTLAAENTRSGSPLMGKIDTQRMALMGHSYGGSAALYAANSNTDPRLKAVIGLNPVTTKGLYSTDHVPSLIIAGIGDPFVSNARAQYNSIPNSTPKVLAILSRTPDVTLGSMHLISHSPLGGHRSDPLVARLGLSFLEAYLMGDERYRQFLAYDPGSLDTLSYRP